MSKEKNTGSRSVSLPFPTCLFCWLSWKCLGTEAGGGGAQVGWRRVTRGWAGLGPHHQEGGEEGSRVPSLVRGGGGGVCPGLLQSLESVPSWLQGSETQEPKVNGGMPAGCAGSPRG